MIVIGARMAGLTAAAALYGASVPVRVFDASDRVGGRVPTKVTSILVEDGRATGVRVARQEVPAAAVIAATDPPTVGKMTKLPQLPGKEHGVRSVTVFLTEERSPGTEPRLVLDATRRLPVKAIGPLSAVQPAYDPAGHHLVAAAIVGEAATSDDFDDLARRVREDVALVLGHQARDWRILETVTAQFAQFAPPPGIHRRLPGNVTPTPGLYLASEATVDSSFNGAMASGETAAAVVRRGLLLANVEARAGNDDTR